MIKVLTKCQYPPPTHEQPPSKHFGTDFRGPFIGPFGAHTYSLVPRTPPSSKVVTRWQSFRSLITPIPLYHTRSSCVIRGRKWLCHTVYDKTKVFFGASYPVTSTAKPCICIRSQKTVPNNLVGRCRHNHTTITPVHAHQKIPLFYHKTYDTTIYFSETKKKCFPLLELGVSYAVSYAQLIGVKC